MRPSSKKDDKRMELFRERLENILDRNHELYRLAGLFDWDAFGREFGAFYAAKKGCPGIPIQLMVGLSYLDHAYGLSDEAVVAKWVENPYWPLRSSTQLDFDYWTSTSCASENNTRWTVNFWSGGVVNRVESATYYIRAVCDRQ